MRGVPSLYLPLKREKKQETRRSQAHHPMFCSDTIDPVHGAGHSGPGVRPDRSSDATSPTWFRDRDVPGAGDRCTALWTILRPG